MRRRAVKRLSAALSENYGVSVIPPRAVVSALPEKRYEVIYVNGDASILMVDEQAIPTVRGLLAHPATKRWVTVDDGAVPFICNGADVMGPGVTDADPNIEAGNLVWVKEERHGKPLAVGRALVSGKEMRKKGKVLENIHWVGDRLWHSSI